MRDYMAISWVTDKDGKASLVKEKMCLFMTDPPSVYLCMYVWSSHTGMIYPVAKYGSTG